MNSKVNQAETMAFQKPTLQEIETFAKSKGYDRFNAEKFFEAHEKRGWLSRNGLTIDWRRAVVHEGYKLKMLYS